MIERYGDSAQYRLRVFDSDLKIIIGGSDEEAYRRLGLYEIKSAAAVYGITSASKAALTGCVGKEPSVKKLICAREKGRFMMWTVDEGNTYELRWDDVEVLAEFGGERMLCATSYVR